jgi:hypothetical protein
MNAVTPTPSATQLGLVDTLIKGMKTDPSGNLFSMLDDMFLLANNDSQQTESVTGIINLNVASYNGTPGAGPTKSGITGNIAGNFFIYLLGNPSGLTHWSQNSASFGAYCTSTANANASANECFIATNDTAQSQMLYQNVSSANYITEGVNANGSSNFAGVTNGSGMWSGVRTGSAGANDGMYNNLAASYFFSGSATSAAPGTGNVLMFAQSTVPARCCGQTLAVGYVGAGLTQPQVAALHGYINAYMTSLGTNVY